MKVGSGNVLHSPIAQVAAINGNPGGDRLGWGQGPIRRILMPTDGFAVARHFTEEMSRPNNDVRANEVLDPIEDARVGCHVPNGGTAVMESIDGIGILPHGREGCEHFIEGLAIAHGLFFGLDGEGADDAAGVVELDLCFGEGFGPARIGGIEVGGSAGIRGDGGVHAPEFNAKNVFHMDNTVGFHIHSCQHVGPID